MSRKKPSPLLVANGSAIKIHNKTGRQLNVMGGTNHVSIKDLESEEFQSKLRAFNIALIVSRAYKKDNSRSRVKTIDFIQKLIIWLVFHPNKYLKVISKYTDLSTPTIKNIIDFLELKEWIEVYQGFPTQKGYSKPMVIHARGNLLNMKID